jgi:hypothetical protein
MPSITATADSADPHSLIAALNYNFAKYADWPDEETIDSIQLCFFNDSYQHGFTALNGKNIFDKTVVVRQLASLDEASRCQLLFLDRAEQHLLKKLFKSLQHKPVLTVSDIQGFIEQGGMIEIIRVNERLRFKVNLTEMQAAQLNMSSQVLKLAVEVK